MIAGWRNAFYGGVENEKESVLKDPITFTFVLLFLLQTKHLFADFFLQTPRMLRDRGKYLHLGRLQHAGLHAAGSMIVMMLIGVPIGLGLTVAAVEMFVHFHIDWGKGRWSDYTGYGPNEAGFWRSFGFDQALHQWTYLVMVWFLLP
ncbi:MAG: DUF3307 domain-containing protein [Tateyamaria sp.]|jgi:hypothetical protein|nr:DUF3307 domain-containing protein [Tateyamaria sp.]MBT5301405.1 DUF3307 domain-containing protein [Tateyamaria sp.]MBT6267897.1 DUF3307 domain-containing protein [Tateyamaria sp.]MBT6344238.1 DUF3307 domain-containing protein [Tateyamaria sp.]MBT7446537.1 DUF3307 domain-containing protein [Tateyamaria sp.]